MMEIDSLLGIIPTKEEEKLLLEYKGSITELAKPERYLFKVKEKNILNFIIIISINIFLIKAFRYKKLQRKNKKFKNL